MCATAQEIISACFKFKWSGFFLKLDFTKSLDTIDWNFLLKVLQVRVGAKWFGWIQAMLSSGFSLVFANGQPDAPFNCRRRVCQGGPLSPYLFILGVDVFSCVMKQAYGGFVQRVGPWNLGISWLQYADDTIMLLPPDLVSIKRVKNPYLPLWAPFRAFY